MVGPFYRSLEVVFLVVPHESETDNKKSERQNTTKITLKAPSVHASTMWDVTLPSWAVGKVVHLHGDGKILQVVKELEEGPKLLKSDSLHRNNNQIKSKAFIHGHDTAETRKANKTHVSTLRHRVLKFTQCVICFLSSCGESFSVCGTLESSDR